MYRNFTPQCSDTHLFYSSCVSSIVHFPMTVVRYPDVHIPHEAPSMHLHRPFDLMDRHIQMDPRGDKRIRTNQSSCHLDKPISIRHLFSGVNLMKYNFSRVFSTSSAIGSLSSSSVSLSSERYFMHIRCTSSHQWLPASVPLRYNINPLNSSSYWNRT